MPVQALKKLLAAFPDDMPVAMVTHGGAECDRDIDEVESVTLGELDTYVLRKHSSVHLARVMVPAVVMEC